MKIPDNMNPALVASKDETRYIINQVQLKDGLIAATDGRRLAVMVAEDSDDEDSRTEALIPVAAIKAAIKGKKGRHYKNEIQIMDKSFVVRDGADSQTTFADNVEGNFPNVRGVLPNREKHTMRIALNTGFLAELAKALGSVDGVTLHLDPGAFSESYDGGFFVTGASNFAFGILMPLRSSGSLSNNRELDKLLERDVPPEVGPLYQEISKPATDSAPEA